VRELRVLRRSQTVMVASFPQDFHLPTVAPYGQALAEEEGPVLQRDYTSEQAQTITPETNLPEAKMQTPSKPPTSVRFDPATKALISQAAKRRGLKLGEYLREVAREQALREMATCGECGRPHTRAKRTRADVAA